MNDVARRSRRAALEGARVAGPRRVLGYARVSSAEQALGTSLKDQQESIRAYASTLGLKVAHFYVEAESGIREKAEQRIQLRNLLAEASEGDLVLVDKLDRWSRDTEHTLRTVRELAERGASFFAVSDRCDPALREGQLMLTIRAALAKEEHARIRERTVGTRKLLREKGHFVEGKAPFGYRRRGGKGIEKNDLLVVLEEGDVVRDVFARYIRGQSMLRIADETGRPLYFVKRVLDRRIYAGEIETSKGWIRAQCEPLIDVATFARAKALAAERRLGGARPRGTPAQTAWWTLRDVARCMHCGARMAAAYAERRTGGTDYYYRCAHRCEAIAPQVRNGSYVPIAEVEEPFQAMVIERLVELRDELGRGPKKEPPRGVVDTAARRAKLLSKRELYADTYADGALSREELRAKLRALDDDLLKLDAEEASRRPKPVETREYRREALRELTVLALAWERAGYGTGRIRRDIVNRLAVEVRIARDELPAPRWRPLADLIA